MQTKLRVGISFRSGSTFLNYILHSRNNDAPAFKTFISTPTTSHNILSTVTMASSNPEEKNSPPAPPPPPPPSDPHSKISPYVLKLRSAPPDYIYQPPIKPEHTDPFAAPTGPYFFYGTLTDPLMISEILELPEVPKLRSAHIIGYECKMWGQYPALLDSPGSVVEGAAYHVRTTQDAKRLAAYETANYRAEDCLIRYTDGKEPSEDLGYTFKFVGDPCELTEGEFDLKVWLRRMGRHAAADKLEAAKCEK
jgi:hypothetical protein